MSPISPRARAIELLGRAPLRHVVSLKMLAHLGEQVDLRLVEAAGGWALLLTFASDAFEYDAKTYGRGRRVAVLDGTLEQEQVSLLERLPDSVAVLKAHHPSVVRHAIDKLGARRATAFVSFTTPGPPNVGTSVAATRGSVPELSSSGLLNGEVLELMARNGYAAAELERYFAGGARWFALRAGGRVSAACFVFRNFDPVWEVAGVHTEQSQRRQGLAARVVRAAVEHLLGHGLLPRYQTESSNLASIGLARSIGLEACASIEHLLLPGRQLPLAST